MTPCAPQDDANPGAERSARLSGAVKRFAPLAVLVIGLLAFFALGLDSYISTQTLREHRAALTAWIGENRVLAICLSTLVYAAITAFSIPIAALTTVVLGFLLGTLWASVSVVIGATGGACVVFLAARTAFADLLRARAGPFIARMEKGFREDALSYMLVLRLIPLFPFWLVNLVPAFLGVPLSIFAAGTLVGIIPATVVYALFGSGIGDVLDSGEEISLTGILNPALVLALIGLAVLALIPVLYKRYRTRRAGS